MGLKQRWKNLSLKYKVLSIIFMSVFLLGSATAVWISQFSGSSGYDVTSDVPIHFTGSLSLDNIDVSNESYYKNEVITLQNDNGAVDFNFTIIKNESDVFWDDCTDWEDDCDLKIEYLGEEISSGIHEIPSGTSVLNVTSSCERYSCPQHLEAEISINPIE